MTERPTSAAPEAVPSTPAGPRIILTDAEPPAPPPRCPRCGAGPDQWTDGSGFGRKQITLCACGEEVLTQ